MKLKGNSHILNTSNKSRLHKGLPIGERDRKKYDRNIMKTLRNSIQEKFNFRKKLDQLSKSSNLNDFMAYKQYLDGVQEQIVSTQSLTTN